MRQDLARTATALLLVMAGCSGDNGGSGEGAAQTDAPASTTESVTGTSVASDDADTLERYADYDAEQYDGTDNWLCHPDAADLCDSDLDATEIVSDGATRRLSWSADEDAAIDCFYVYPTISGDSSPNSDLDASPDEEGYAARNQVARLGSECRVFAPVYRQVTLAGLAGTATPEGRDLAYDDVLDAWKSYMAQANQGRGVVLIGHSQGAGLLRRLIAEEIDPNDDVRALLVSAFLAGTSVAVPEAEDVGGDFREIPLCRTPDDTGCVVSWSTYRSTSPPPEGAIFGRTNEPGMRAACVNPADLSGGSTELTGFFPATRGGTILAGGEVGAPENPTVDNAWVDPAVAVIETPFVSLPTLTTGECTSNDQVDWLEITVNGDPEDPLADDIGGDLSPEWGLHLLDVNLVMGDIEGLVGTQAESYGG